MIAYVAVTIAIGNRGGSPIDHLTDGSDTRSHVWNALYDDFTGHLLLGRMEGAESGVGENSYLSAGARLGLLGLIPLLIFVVVVIVNCAKVLRIRSGLGEYTMLADLVVAGFFSLLLGAMFEGYLMGTLSIEIFAIYIYAPIAAFLIDAGHVALADPSDPYHEHHDLEHHETTDPPVDSIGDDFHEAGHYPGFGGLG